MIRVIGLTGCCMFLQMQFVFGQDTVQSRIPPWLKPSRSGVSIAMNYFPAFYLPTETKSWNSVLYGYHLGAFSEQRYVRLRLGFNLNYFTKKSSAKIQEYTLGIELGLEKDLVTPTRKWLVAFGINFYRGRWWTFSYFSPTYSEKVISNEWGVGPILMIGRKCGENLIITTETSVSIGQYYKTINGGIFERGNPAYQLWKLFGIGIRYYIN